MPKCRRCHEARLAGAIGESKEVQARDYSTEGNTTFPEKHCFAHQKAAISKTSEGDRPGL